MRFADIDRSNYLECISLSVDESQAGFVADNKQSLVEAAYEEGLYPLAIYHEEQMIGFLLYDYDKTIPGWSLSRFMIGRQYQSKGYGKQAAKEFLTYIKAEQHIDRIYISVSLENIPARKMFSSLGFSEIKEIEYSFMGSIYREMQMVKEL